MFTIGRRAIKAPEGHSDHLSRRQAVARLGLRSEFKLRQLEKAGMLHPVHGELGSAWYSIVELDAVAAQLGPADPIAPRARAGRTLSDAELLSLLRLPLRPPGVDATPRWRTPADLVLETGISLARAERIHRFFITWDDHEAARAARERAEAQRRRQLDDRVGGGRARPDAAVRDARRERLEVRQAAFVQLKALARDPDPAVRMKAVEQLSECLRNPEG